jgi:serine/threonine-protein kinase HipA
MAKDLEALFNRIRALEIDTPQGHSGRLSRESRFVFNYRDTAEESTAVSLVMPVRSQSYASGDLMGVFAMNRPEGYLRYIIEERLKRLGAPDDMLLLWLSGGNGIGRLDYRLPGEDRPADTGERLDTLLRSPSPILFADLVDRYALRSGISGVQPKTVVPLRPEPPDEHAALALPTVIVKAEGSDYPGLARNEFLCLSVAREAGLEVPDFRLSEDGLLLVLDRFDRTPDGRALGFEDMAVLTGRGTARKYEGSYEMVAKAVSIFTAEAAGQELPRLFARVALSCKLRDGDAHLKNFGLLYGHPAGPRRLAPVYDVVCTDIYPELDGKLALKLNQGKLFPDDRELLAFGQRLGLAAEDAQAVLTRLDMAIETVLARLAGNARFTEDGLLGRIRAAIRGELERPVSPRRVR